MLLGSIVVGVLVGAPLAYVLTGIVLGDVGPLEATGRSLRVFSARRLAAALVAAFESTAIVLVVLGLGAGLDLVLRVVDTLGVGLDSGPLGLLAIELGLAVLVFAFGTLVYTALAISVAPQVVMFVGLTRATMGLDHVLAGGGHDPVAMPSGSRSFRWMTIPMRLAIGGGIALLIALLASLDS
jgi:hypothetical protein